MAKESIQLSKKWNQLLQMNYLIWVANVKINEFIRDNIVKGIRKENTNDYDKTLKTTQKYMMK